jgi:hypothetical protein
MKPITLFNALMKIESMKSVYQNMRRKGSQGIAVNDDPSALAYQRASRQSFKMQERLRKILEKL